MRMGLGHPSPSILRRASEGRGGVRPQYRRTAHKLRRPYGHLTDDLAPARGVMLSNCGTPTRAGAAARQIGRTVEPYATPPRLAPHLHPGLAVPHRSAHGLAPAGASLQFALPSSRTCRTRKNRTASSDPLRALRAPACPAVEIFNLTDLFMALFEKRIDADSLFAVFCGPSRCKISARTQGHKLLISLL